MGPTLRSLLLLTAVAVVSACGWSVHTLDEEAGPLVVVAGSIDGDPARELSDEEAEALQLRAGAAVHQQDLAAL